MIACPAVLFGFGYNKEDMADRVQSVEKMIEQFSPEELSRFAVWFADFRDGIWERQIERDSNAGRLDKLIEKAHKDFGAGLAKEI